MTFFDDMFDPDFLFDSGHKQRRDIRNLQAALQDTGADQAVQRLEVRVNQLQLLTNALVKMLEVKKIASPEEIEVLVQQIDLLDGVEDGREGTQAWTEAPRCPHCSHYVNPARPRCVYCSRSIEGSGSEGPYRGGAAKAKTPVRTATCAACQSVVPQNETVFTGDGSLHCLACSSWP